MMFCSPTYGEMPLKDVPEYLLSFYESNAHYGTGCYIIVGSDSQNYDVTKSVTVVSIICKGHGGIFFYRIEELPIMRNVREKLYSETQHSLEVTDALIGYLESKPKYAEMYQNCPISIHVDAGNSPKGKTAPLIPEIVGWVRSLGYECHVKPESFVASSVADKLSK